jgi:dihydroorotate dehydrogenase
MGFNNQGVDKAVERLKARKSSIIVGGNIGKNKITPNQDAISDYLICLHALHHHVDYFVVNISSPNTPGLRELQDKEPLTALLKAVTDANRTMEKPKPILLKIAPDLTLTQVDDILQIAAATKLDGLIAPNTTISRDGLLTTAEKLTAIGAGGLSGQPVEARATALIDYIVKTTAGKLPVIGVGGIMNPDDAMRKLDAGASLIQLYTGFVYGGPGLPKRICRKLV